MRTDEVLIVAVGLMLCASILMGLNLRLALDRSRKAFEALAIQLSSLTGSTLNLDQKVERLERRIAELEGDLPDAEQTRSQPHPLN